MNELTHSDFFHLLNQKSRAIKKQLNTILNKYNLYTSQWTILYVVTKFGTMTQTDLWSYLNVEAPTVTRTLERMEQNGWVLRTPGEDKRERMIELTEQAHNLFHTIMQEIIEMENEFLADFSEEDKKSFYQLLQKIKA